jgi:exodeoxyribonuclease VII small subunit
MTTETNFEAAFQALQEVIEKLENSELPLQDALALYERGKALSSQCAAILEKAQLRVSQLGEETAAPFAEDQD